jgi:mono/diheme cytochrome c family protein
MSPSSLVVAVAEATEPVGDVRVGLGAVVLTVAVVGFLVWVGYLVLNARRRSVPQIEETPPNLQPWLSDDELENNRLTRVLGAAVIAAAVLAISLPLYWANESNRQASAEEAFAELYVEEGEHWYEVFSCINCHGPDAGGGGAPFTEARSDISVSWAAPSINDVFYRYSVEEITEVIVYGRAGSPMPANGLDGGGAMSVQEVEQVVAFLEHIQIDQAAVLAEVDPAVDLALARIADGDATVATEIAEQEATLADILAAPEVFAVFESFPDDIDELLSGNGTCTKESAELVTMPCRSPGQDTDRDGLTDTAERRLTELAAAMHENVLVRNNQLELVRQPVYDIAFLADDAFTNSTPTGEPIPDLEEAEAFITALDADHLTLGVQTARNDVFVSGVEERIAYLLEAARERAWDIDFDAVARAMSERSALDAAALFEERGESSQATVYSVEDARRAVGLFNAYCARCHTAGYSAGVAFEQGHGTGAWGPALIDGRSIVQFPLFEDQVDFIIRGTNFRENYGVNGLGSGRMPGFGQSLTAADIELIVAYERSL